MTATFARQLAAEIGGTLIVRREDIVFTNVSPEVVRIEVTVRNDGLGPSRPATAMLQSAPLGAFVPWRPLALLRVPSLEPGESVVLHTEATTALPAPLGPPDRVAPRQLLTALGAEDDRPAAARPARPLATDLLRLVGRPGTHWAGNLNVFIGGKPVERHLAQALRVYPGQVNVAMFVVGSGPDEYRFRLEGDAAGWNATLSDATQQARVIDLVKDAAIAPDAWVPVQATALMLLALQPPVDCKQGNVEVHVTQRSSGQTAVVEFSLDPKAAGPGCYVVG